jgi:hypothetical protein
MDEQTSNPAFGSEQVLIKVCRNLASGLTGENGGSYPVPMSSSSIEYWNISDEERNKLSETIAAAVAAK